MFTKLVTRLFNRPAPGKRRWTFVYLLALVLFAGAGLLYYRLVFTPAEAASESQLQTAVVRQGNLSLSATGTGSLTSPKESLGFTSEGESTVTGVYVKVGDLVQAGELLAEVDRQQAQADYAAARQKYLDLTSETAIAAAARSMANAQSELQAAKLQLEYLISPDVMYWESQVTDTLAALKTAQDSAATNPGPQAQTELEQAEARLSFMQSKLTEAQEKYLKEYAPETFPIAVDGDTDTYLVPTAMEIKQARLAIDEATAKLEESQDLVAVLTGAPMPQDTSNESLIAIQRAKNNLDQAEARLDGTRILAPFSGTVMEVNIAAGDTVAPKPADSTVVDASNAITLADTGDPYLEVFWDESDWKLVKTGGTVEITFDDLPDQVFSGKITEVDRELVTSGSSNVVRGEVSLDSTYADLDLPVGASASVEAISQRVQDAIYIPLEALHEAGSGQYAVFVMVDGKLKVRTVDVGLENAQYAQILSGVQAGDVVSTGLVKTK